MSFYLLNKQSGITSNKALNEFKYKNKILKAGFSGVLDPFATGLLIVATDEDTKFLSLFLNMDKVYTGKILFNKRTDTLDIDGNIIEENKNVKINIDELKKIIDKNFIGKIKQIPPKFSNIKVDGVRAHKLSRTSDKEFELKPVDRNINYFKILDFADDYINFEVSVSSGTYIRSLARDLGDLLNLPSMLESLKRVSIGDIKLEDDSIDFKEVERKNIISFEEITVDKNEIKNILDGKNLFKELKKDDYLFTNEEKVIWVKKQSKNYFKIYKRIK